MDIIAPAEMVGVSADIDSSHVVRDIIPENLVVIAHRPEGDTIVVRIDRVVVYLIVTCVIEPDSMTVIAQDVAVIADMVKDSVVMYSVVITRGKEPEAVAVVVDDVVVEIVVTGRCS